MLNNLNKKYLKSSLTRPHRGEGGKPFEYWAVGI